MVKYLDIVKYVASKFEEFTIKKIPREQNVEAVALANIGSVSAALNLSKSPLCMSCKLQQMGIKEMKPALKLPLRKHIGRMNTSNG